MGSNPNNLECLAKIINFPFTCKSINFFGHNSFWLLNVNLKNFHWKSLKFLWTFRTWKLASNSVEFKFPLCDRNLASMINGEIPTNSVKLHFGQGLEFGPIWAQMGLPKIRMKIRKCDILIFFYIFDIDGVDTQTRVFSTGVLNILKKTAMRLLDFSYKLSSRSRSSDDEKREHKSRRSWQSRF